MTNKVLIDGHIVKSTWGKTEESGFFVTIKQERKVNNFTWANYFPLYANRPLADQLAKIVEKNANAYIMVEGQLRTYHSKKTGEWKISIQVEKIIQEEPVASTPEAK
jgi:neutral trehalase